MQVVKRFIIQFAWLVGLSSVAMMGHGVALADSSSPAAHSSQTGVVDVNVGIAGTAVATTQNTTSTSSTAIIQTATGGSSDSQTNLTSQNEVNQHSTTTDDTLLTSQLSSVVPRDLTAADATSQTVQSVALDAAHAQLVATASTGTGQVFHGYVNAAARTATPGSPGSPGAVPAPLSSHSPVPVVPVNLPALPAVLLQQLGGMAGLSLIYPLLDQFGHFVPVSHVPATTLLTLATLIVVGFTTVGSLFLARQSAGGYTASPRGTPARATTATFATPQLVSLTIGIDSRIGSFFDELEINRSQCYQERR